MLLTILKWSTLRVDAATQSKLPLHPQPNFPYRTADNPWLLATARLSSWRIAQFRKLRFTVQKIQNSPSISRHRLSSNRWACSDGIWLRPRQPVAENLYRSKYQARAQLNHSGKTVERCC